MRKVERRQAGKSAAWVRKLVRYSDTTTVCYGIHERSECIPVDSGVTNLIHHRRSCVYFTLGSRGECGSICPLMREQARRECDSGL